MLNVKLTDLAGNVIFVKNYSIDEAGYHKIKIELDQYILENLNSGLYSLSIVGDNYKEYKKMLFVD